MPPNKKMIAAKAGPAGDTSAAIYNTDKAEDVESPSSSNEDEAECLKSGQKRGATKEQSADFALEMNKMLESFGTDISKTLSVKRRRLEQITSVTSKNTNKKVEEVWKAQQNDRAKLTEEYDHQVKAALAQWESDLTKAKEQEDKLQHLFQQQQKLFQQTRVVQAQRLKTIKQLHEQFAKGLGELDQCHADQQGSVHSELKKEMALLQKRILMDTQQQEMANVRKSLQTMLF